MYPLLRGLVLSLTVIAATPVWALATFESAASSAFASAAEGVVIGPGTGGSKAVSGNGVATFAGMVSPDGELPATIVGSVDGSAFAPPLSSATATQMAGHVFTIDQTGEGGVTVPFSFAIEWSTELAVDDLAHEVAVAGAYFAVSGFDIDTLTIDDTVTLGERVFDDAGKLIRWEFNPVRSTSAGDFGSAAGFALITGTVVVAADTVGMWSVITDVSGFAGARVPEPGALSLVALAAGLLTRRRRSIAG